MKYCFLSLVICFSLLNAQSTKIAISLKVESSDKKSVMTLNKEVDPGEPIEGYFAKYLWKDKRTQTEWTEGKIQDGGYSILKESSFFKTMLNIQESDVEAKRTEISGMLPPVQLTLFRNVFSFYLTPFYYKELDSIAIKTGRHGMVAAKEELIPSANIYLQYINYKMPESELYKVSENVFGRRVFDEDFILNAKYSGANFIAAFGEEYNLNYISNIYDQNSIMTLKLLKYDDGIRKLPIEIDNTLHDSLESSIQRSTINKMQIDFSVEFQRKLELNTINPSLSETQFFTSDANIRYVNTFNYSYRINDLGEKNYTEGVHKALGGINKIKMYYSQLEIPFVINNVKKNIEYGSYTTKEKLMRGTYSIFIVPQSYSDKGLVVDLFIHTSKINIGDGVARWSPIKKQLFIPNDWKMVAIELPKENWSAVFSKGDEKYEIYGYSDYERFYKEKLFIKVNNITMEH